MGRCIVLLPIHVGFHVVSTCITLTAFAVTVE